MVSLDCNNVLPSLALPFQYEHKLLKNEVQNMDQFSENFIQFGISRLFWIEDTKIKVADLNGYRPRLLGIIWFYGKIK